MNTNFYRNEAPLGADHLIRGGYGFFFEWKLKHTIFFRPYQKQTIFFSAVKLETIFSTSYFISFSAHHVKFSRCYHIYQEFLPSFLDKESYCVEYVEQNC